MNEKEERRGHCELCEVTTHCLTTMFMSFTMYCVLYKVLFRHALLFHHTLCESCLHLAWPDDRVTVYISYGSLQLKPHYLINRCWSPLYTSRMKHVLDISFQTLSIYIVYNIWKILLTHHFCHTHYRPSSDFPYICNAILVFLNFSYSTCILLSIDCDSYTSVMSIHVILCFNVCTCLSLWLPNKYYHIYI